MLNMGAWPLRTLPIPDGSISEADRSHFLGLYSGIALDEPVEIPGLIGAMSLTLDNAKTTLAKATAFQTWVGASTQAEAEGHIAKWQDLFVNYPRPYAILSWLPGVRRVWVAQGASGQEFEPWVSGTINARFIAEWPKRLETNPSEAFEEFFDDVEAAMEGMADISGVDTNLVFLSYALNGEPEVYLAEDGNLDPQGHPFNGFAMEFSIEVGVGGV